MCGIAGYSFKSSSVSSSRRAILATSLALLNVDRGRSSWGVVKLNQNKNQLVIKRGLGPISGHIYTLLDANTLYLHTRAATCGATTIENAHPFTFGNIIGAHNGAVYNHRLLDAEYDREFEVDSMHLFAHLSEGLDFSDVEGYGAIEWINKEEPKRIYFCRISDGGQLSVAGIGKTEDTHGIVWSSSGLHLESALKSAGFKNYFEYPTKPFQVYFVEDGKLYIKEDQKLEVKDTDWEYAGMFGFDGLNWSRQYRRARKKSKSPKLLTSGRNLDNVVGDSGIISVFRCTTCGIIKTDKALESDDYGEFMCPKYPQKSGHNVILMGGERNTNPVLPTD